MDLPDCPPGAEGYEDSVIVVPSKNPMMDEGSCTKAEQEFQNHLDSLKIRLEDGSTRCMVERRGRDIAGKWIYLCYPCAAICAGEPVLQTHISGKKHKSKIGLKTMWPLSMFEEHPYILNVKGKSSKPAVPDYQGSGKQLSWANVPDNQLAEARAPAPIASSHGHNKTSGNMDLEEKYERYRTAKCHIQDTIDQITAPLLGVEYLVEYPPEEPHHEPQYMCTLCFKQGYPRTIVNHMTCFWHRFNYLARHFQKAHNRLYPFRGNPQCREAVMIVINRLAQRIEDKFGRLRPVNIDKEEYEKNKENIHRWLANSYHISENSGHTFEEVVDVNLIESLRVEKNTEKKANTTKEPSPPVVAAPSKPRTTNLPRGAARERRISVGSLSDVSDEPEERRREPDRDRNYYKDRYEPYPEQRRTSPFRSRYALRNVLGDTDKKDDKEKKPNHHYKVKLAHEKRAAAEAMALKTLSYHEKNPEKHPLYPDEWKKFWNRRYKELQTEGKDTAKHDFKPEWIVYWTARMKELHQEELQVVVNEIYRKLCLTPPDLTHQSPEPKRKSSEPRRKSPGLRRNSLDLRRQSPPIRRKSPELRHDSRYHTPERRRSPNRRRSTELRHRLSALRRRTPEYRNHRSPDYRSVRSPERRHTPPRALRSRSRSRSPIQRRSPIRLHLPLDGARRSRSPLSRRESALRNRSPAHMPALETAPSLQTVLISDDELKPDDGLSPWNSDNDLESLGSLPEARSPVPARSHAGSVASSRDSRVRREPFVRAHQPRDLGPAENVVATLRMLVALEDYLGSLGPKIMDLLTEALKMEKEKANSSEELLERESAVVLMETAKEKLKGAAQAGLVASGATPAVRAAVVRVAATLHEADTRARRKQSTETVKNAMSASAALPVAGVGAVDRAQIAQQMAAALVAQGKTDVTSEELASLVDAVVGMAEAKKREAEVKKKTEARKGSERVPPTAAGTASALQMLQSAYDETDKKAEAKEEAPDAMDGLSDSDLETLLKNFSELSAEEQHSLIAYLKKLEAREPARVERLRQYVNVAAAEPPAPEQTDAVPVALESDDDDYTVEEVFNTAKQKVKEDQIRQEMEIVKKSLEESKVVTSKPEPAPAITNAVPTIDITKGLSTATGLLAMVQASLQSTGAAAPPPIDTAPPSTNVTTTNLQPRSFGDLPEPPNVDKTKPNVQNVPPNQPAPLDQQGSFQRPPMSQMNFNRSSMNDSYNRGSWNSRPHNVLPDNQGNITENWGKNTSDNWGEMPDNRGNMNNWNNAPDNRSNISDNWGNTPDNRGNVQVSRGNPPDNRGNMQNKWENAPHNRGNVQDNWGNAPDNRGNVQDNWGKAPDNRGNVQGNWGNAPDNPAQVQDSWGNTLDNRGNMQNNWGNTPDNRGNTFDNRGNTPDNRGNTFDNRGNTSDNRGNTFDNRGNTVSNRGSASFGPGIPYNQGPRGNFMNGKPDIRPHMNQFGSQNQNFVRRGGGRGNFRGRGRGGPY